MSYLYGKTVPEKDACGLGYIANIDNVPNHRVIEQGREMLDSVVHRGAVAADQSTGDGSGCMTQIPYKLLAKEFSASGFTFAEGELALGQFFMPTDPEVHAQVVAMIDAVLKKHGVTLTQWRDVPMDTRVLSSMAKASMPRMQQLLIARPEGIASEQFDDAVRRMLYDLEASLAHADEAVKKQFYIPSFSARTVVYKGLLRSDQVMQLYTDFNDADYESAFVLAHNRFSTNTVSQWKSAHPFRSMAHNGEINTIKGNIEGFLQRMKEVHGKDFFIDPNYSDSARMDLMLGQYMLEGMALEDAVMAISRPEFRNNPNMRQEVRDYFRHRALEFPQLDGPQMLILTDGKKVVGHTDSFGLRPACCTLTNDGQVIFASEFGAVNVPEHQKKRQFNVPAGGVFTVDLESHQVRIGDEVLESLATQKDFGSELAAREVRLDAKQAHSPTAHRQFDHETMQIASGWTADDVEKIVRPVRRDGKNPVSAMGQQGPNAALSHLPRPLSDYLAQKFAQVSNPPLDSEREGVSMNLETYLGAHPGKVKDAPFIRLNSPLLRPGELEALQQQANLPVATLDMTAAVEAVRYGTLEHALKRLGEQAVQAASNHQVLVLSDRALGLDRMKIDATLAVAAVDAALKKAGKRLNCSIVVDSAQIMTGHQQAVLLGLGAQAVNPYLLYDEAVLQAEGDHQEAAVALENVAKAFDKGLLKIMAKMGVADVNAYIGGRLFEARGLSLNGALGQYLGGIDSKFGGHGLREMEENMYATHAVALAKARPEALQALMAPLFEDHEPGTWWANIQQLAGDSVELAAHGLPKVGRYSKVRGGERQLRDGNAEYRKLEAQHNKEDGLLLRKLQAFLELDEAERSSVQEWIESLPVHQQALALHAVRHGIPSYLLTRKEGEGRIYSPAEMALHALPDDLRQHYRHEQTARADHPHMMTDLLELEGKGALPLEQVVQPDVLLGNLRIAAMSHGALQANAHRAMSRIARNLGAKSNSGEGGELPERQPDGLDNASNSPIRQVASGRWGMDLANIAGAEEIEIKVAQGAKPGEGGQLPGSKVTVEIARLRGGIPGVELTSPPPHHDMYSIEDLEQLIKDIKAASTTKEQPHGVKVSVKLVASEGIGTIACGVIKAGADGITVAGGNGGTGAAETLSINHAGMEVTQGVREVHQALTAQGLRARAAITQSGGITTPRDVVMAYLLGADKTEVGTEALIKAGGCEVAKLCNTGCPRFLTTDGQNYNRPDRVGEREFIYFMQAVREELAQLGIADPRQAVGRIGEFARMRSVEELAATGLRAAKKFTFDAFLAMPEPPKHMAQEPAERCYLPPAPIEAHALADWPANATGTEWIDIRNCDRSVGAMLSRQIYETYAGPRDADYAAIARRNGKSDLPAGLVQLRLKGYAGNSLGAMNYGCDLYVKGTANDYCGKGMSAGSITLMPGDEQTSDYVPTDNAVVGNKLGFGARGGEFYVLGSAGEKFLVRNSGASAVIAGDVGDYACEYMTRGSAVILGEVGNHFGKGMSGGVVAIYDPNKKFNQHGDFTTHRLEDFAHEDTNGAADAVRGMLQKFQRQIAEGGKECALVQEILNDPAKLNDFVFVLPKGLHRGLEQDAAQLQRIEEAFDGQEKTPLVEAVLDRYSRVAMGGRA